ncbi:hypothetical protein [Pontibacter mangrovi]|uniref:Uncharacterized protein n=1 Tax=Pontibacter mangrovi TaxID=2589816 RepID=A0A501W6Q7_9BACT|nr:hypothetical protein [Pontibacter mangrovi]TPE42971.1 hypothetical protein FJM65_15095 [Pontibacter mangrovi]
MNRDYENDDNLRKNHYADFDEHGNPLTGNRNSLSRYNPGGHFGSDRYARDERRHGDDASNAARAYGDMSRGTRYGEGGSYRGGGSAYGHSYYGMSGQEGPRITQHDRGNWPDSRQYNAYGDAERNRGHRFSDSFGRTSDGGYVNEDRSQGYQRRYDEGFQGNQRFGNPGRENTGYDRGYRDFGSTGYGTTGYNNRDEDRLRSAYGNRDYRKEEDERRYNERNRNRRQNW